MTFLLPSPSPSSMLKLSNVRSLCSWRDDWQDGICFLGGGAARDFRERRSREIPSLLVAPPSKQYSTRKTMIALTR